MARVLINVPHKVTAGSSFEVRVLIAHPMESGQRRDDLGRAIPRDIIHSFTCTYNGAVVLEADFFPAIAANPFFSFQLRAKESGPVVFTWVDDHGAVGTETAQVVVG
jgi:sulfur-oxidizing protein SoxZ